MQKKLSIYHDQTEYGDGSPTPFDESRETLDKVAVTKTDEEIYFQLKANMYNLAVREFVQTYAGK